MVFNPLLNHYDEARVSEEFCFAHYCRGSVSEVARAITVRGSGACLPRQSIAAVGGGDRALRGEAAFEFGVDRVHERFGGEIRVIGAD